MHFLAWHTRGTSQLPKTTVENYNTIKKTLVFLTSVPAFCFIGNLKISPSAQKWQVPFRFPRLYFTFTFVSCLALVKSVNTAQRTGNKNNWEKLHRSVQGIQETWVPVPVQHQHPHTNKPLYLWQVEINQDLIQPWTRNSTRDVQGLHFIKTAQIPGPSLLTSNGCLRCWQDQSANSSQSSLSFWLPDCIIHLCSADTSDKSQHWHKWLYTVFEEFTALIKCIWIWICNPAIKGYL